MHAPIENSELSAASAAPQANQPTGPAKLSELQIEIISVFVRLLHVIGLPKSAGEIYGLLFTSVVPMVFEEVAAKLEMSNGSVSQGLRMLRALGAVQKAYVPGDRRDHYLAETDIHKLAAGFLRENVEHHLLGGEARLSRLCSLVSHADPGQDPTRDFLEERVEMLKTWNQQARVILPMIVQVLC